LDSAKININKINYFYSLKKSVPIPWPNGLVSQKKKKKLDAPFHHRRLLFINFWFWFCWDFFFILKNDTVAAIHPSMALLFSN
jgi:hypothetical protein